MDYTFDWWGRPPILVVEDRVFVLSDMEISEDRDLIETGGGLKTTGVSITGNIEVWSERSIVEDPEDLPRPIDLNFFVYGQNIIIVEKAIFTRMAPGRKHGRVVEFAAESIEYKPKDLNRGSTLV